MGLFNKKDKGGFKFESIKFEGGRNDIYTRQTINADRIDPNAHITVTAPLVAYIVKRGVFYGPLNPGTHRVFDGKREALNKKDGLSDIDILYICLQFKERFKWGTTNPIRTIDPIAQIYASIGARGEFEIVIDNAERFYKEFCKHQQSIGIDDLRERLVERLIGEEFVPTLARMMREFEYSFTNIQEGFKEIAKGMRYELNKIFAEYGISVTAFFISDVSVTDDDAEEQIIAALNKIGYDAKAAEERRRGKIELMEAVQEIERLSDREWEKEKYLLALKERNYNAYLEACKATGISPDKKAAARFCRKCGEAITAGAMFCNACGERAAGDKICGCGKANPLEGRFCNACGKELK